jgi:lysyl-tRNA synthetase class 1
VRGELPAGYERIFAYAQLSADADAAAEAAAFRPAFAHLALLVQVPGVDIAAHVTAEKGGPLTAREQEILDERVRAARAWLEWYAPDRARVAVRHDRLPVEAADLSEAQRAFLATLADVAEREAPASGDGWQAALFAVAATAALKPGDAFGALYCSFLGRPNGPRAGWLLASLDRAFVIGRLREAAAGGAS